MHKVVQCIPFKTMAALAVLEDIANGAIRRECVFRDREDLLAHDDNWLISCFEGNPPGTVRRAAASVGAQQRGAMRCLCPQVMCTLGFLATGAFQRELANRLRLCKSTLSRAVPAELDGIIRISARYIQFPYNAVNTGQH